MYLIPEVLFIEFFKCQIRVWGFLSCFQPHSTCPCNIFWWSSLPSCAEMYMPTRHMSQLEGEGWVALNLIPRGAQQRPRPPALGGLRGRETGLQGLSLSHSLPFSLLFLPSTWRRVFRLYSWFWIISWQICKSTQSFLPYAGETHGSQRSQKLKATSQKIGNNSLSVKDRLLPPFSAKRTPC